MNNNYSESVCEYLFEFAYEKYTAGVLIQKISGQLPTV